MRHQWRYRRHKRGETKKFPDSRVIDASRLPLLRSRNSPAATAADGTIVTRPLTDSLTVQLRAAVNVAAVTLRPQNNCTTAYYSSPFVCVVCFMCRRESFCDTVTTRLDQYDSEEHSQHSQRSQRSRRFFFPLNSDVPIIAGSIRRRADDRSILHGGKTSRITTARRARTSNFKTAHGGAPAAKSDNSQKRRIKAGTVTKRSILKRNE